MSTAIDIIVPSLVEIDLSKIGASDCSKVLGVDEYETIHDVFARCAYGITPHKPEWIEEASEYGHLLEPVTGTRFATLYGWTGLIKPPSRTPPNREWQRYSMDFIVTRAGGESAPLECKNISERRFAHENWGSQGENIYPLRIVSQVTAQIEGMRADREWWLKEHKIDPNDLQHGFVAVTVGGNRFFSYVVPYDAELAGLQREACERLWVDHILPKRLPPPNASEACLRALNRIYPRALHPLRDATPQEVEIAHAYIETKRSLKELVDKKVSLENLLATAIGEGKGIVGPGFEDGILWLSRQGRPRRKELIDELAAAAGMTKAAAGRLEEDYETKFLADLASRAGVKDAELKMLRNKHRGQPSRFFKVNASTTADEEE